MIYNIMLKPDELQILLDALLEVGREDTNRVFTVLMAYKTVLEREAERRYME